MRGEPAVAAGSFSTTRKVRKRSIAGGREKCAKVASMHFSRIPLLTTLAALTALAQPRAPQPRTELLWPEGAPGAVGNEDADKPALMIYLPPQASATGTGIVVCP